MELFVVVFEQGDVEIVVPRDESAVADRAEERSVHEPIRYAVPFRDHVEDAEDQEFDFLAKPQTAFGGTHGADVQLVVEKKPELPVDAPQGFPHAGLHRQVFADDADFGEKVGKNAHANSSLEGCVRMLAGF